MPRLTLTVEIGNSHMRTGRYLRDLLQDAGADLARQFGGIEPGQYEKRFRDVNGNTVATLVIEPDAQLPPWR